MVAGCLAVEALPALAEKWTVETSLGVQETATNNVNLTPSDIRQSDLITQITPTLRVNEQGAHTSLNGFVSVPLMIYARTGSQNNQVYPTVNLLGTVEFFDKFFNIDGSVAVAQQFFNPFGAQPASLDNPTANRYQTETYTISPYIRGTTPGNIKYEFRNTNSWTNLSGAPNAAADSRYTQWTGTVSRKEATLGWDASFDITNIDFENQNPIRTRLVRVSPLYDIDPQVRLTASAGYEWNEYALTESNNAIYGVGFEWRPTPRTQVSGNWEHRFFGSSYKFLFDHRTPLSVWSVNISRGISTYPQQLALLPSGVPLSGLLNSLFLGSIPDPLDRQRAVDQFLQNRGLPQTLTSPVNIYAQQILLQNQQQITVGLLGVRNSVFITAFNLQSEQITGSGEVLPPAFALGNDIRQTGVNAVWTHNLSSTLVLTANVGGYRSVSKAPFDLATNQGNANIMLTSSLSPNTKAMVGARYQGLRADTGSDYNEVAAFVGLTHWFR